MGRLKPGWTLATGRTAHSILERHTLRSTGADRLRGQRELEEAPPDGGPRRAWHLAVAPAVLDVVVAAAGYHGTCAAHRLREPGKPDAGTRRRASRELPHRAAAQTGNAMSKLWPTSRPKNSAASRRRPGTCARRSRAARRWRRRVRRTHVARYSWLTTLRLARSRGDRRPAEQPAAKRREPEHRKELAAHPDASGQLNVFATTDRQPAIPHANIPANACWRRAVPPTAGW